jgi:hypothetical protein
MAEKQIAVTMVEKRFKLSKRLHEAALNENRIDDVVKLVCIELPGSNPEQVRAEIVAKSAQMFGQRRLVIQVPIQG